MLWKKFRIRWKKVLDPAAHKSPDPHHWTHILTSIIKQYIARWAERYRLAQDTPPGKFYDWEQHIAEEGYLLLAARIRHSQYKCQTALNGDTFIWELAKNRIFFLKIAQSIRVFRVFFRFILAFSVDFFFLDFFLFIFLEFFIL